MAGEGNTYAAGNSGRWSQERLDRIPEYKAAIVSMIRDGMFLSEIALELDMHPSTVREWKARDPEFAEAYSDAEQTYMDRVEKSAHRRAVEGVLEPVISGGRVVMDPQNPQNPLMVRRYSDPLMMFILKGRRREVYGDRQETELTHKFDTAGAKSELERKLAAAAQS